VPAVSTSAALPVLSSLPAPINPSPDALDCLRVGDIPSEVTNEELARFFSMVGVVPLRLHRTVMGDTAYLEFASEADAEKAFALRKETLRHRRLEFTPTTYEKVQRVLRHSPPRESTRKTSSRVDRSRSRSPVRSRSKEQRDRERSSRVVVVRRDFDRGSRGSATSRGGYSPRSRSRSRSPVRTRDRGDDPRDTSRSSDDRTRYPELSSSSSRTSRGVDSYRERARDDYSSSSRK